MPIPGERPVGRERLSLAAAAEDADFQSGARAARRTKTDLEQRISVLETKITELLARVATLEGI
jgi:uncharacterized protein YceH (UPF0502 family)